MNFYVVVGLVIAGAMFVAWTKVKYGDPDGGYDEDKFKRITDEFVYPPVTENQTEPEPQTFESLPAMTPTVQQRDPFALRTYKAKAKLSNGYMQEVRVQADNFDNARAMIEAQYGKGAMPISPLEVRE